MDRPALTRLIDEIKQGLIGIVVVYKVDRLSRSLADFVRLIDLFDRHSVSFVSVTQQFNTSTSMGRLTLNVLLSFAQFEREVTGERIQDKIAASKRKGLWTGGVPPLGYDIRDKALVANPAEARTVRHIYSRYLALGSVRALKAELDKQGVVSKLRQKDGTQRGGVPLSRGALYALLRNPLYVGQVRHRGQRYEGRHEAILDKALWEDVQEKLAQNRSARDLNTAAKDPSLLAGKLFDDKHHPMSPSHSRKKSRRYRYYVSQAVLLYREQEAGSVIRIPAQAIEARVVAKLRELLRAGDLLLSLLRPGRLSATTQGSVIARAEKLAADWDELPAGHRIDLIKRIVRNVVVGREQISITVATDNLAAELLGDDARAGDAPSARVPLGDHVIRFSAQLKRCGIETRLVVPTQTPAAALPHSTTVHAIRQAVMNALRWNQALLDGAVGSMAELAKQNDVTQRYIARIIKLAFLAPDILQAALRGQLPSDLSLERLNAGFPLDWDEQRRVLGFSRRAERARASGAPGPSNPNPLIRP